MLACLPLAASASTLRVPDTAPAKQPKGIDTIHDSHGYRVRIESDMYDTAVHRKFDKSMPETPRTHNRFLLDNLH